MNTPVSPKKVSKPPLLHPYANFCQSLEKFQKNKFLTHKDSNQLHMLCQSNYHNMYFKYGYPPHYYSVYSGGNVFMTPHTPVQTNQLQCSSSESTLNVQELQVQDFLKWQEDHELKLDSFEKLKVHRIKKPIKEKVHIDIKVCTLRDLLNIIETHPYCNTKEYNIDLEALHKIKPELDQIQSMIGLEKVKDSVLKQLLYFLQGFAHDSQYGDYKHTVITGPPGTGKTELAKLLGNMYAKVGVLKNNAFKKVTRTDLVAGYLGQTAIKTKKVIDECMGGVLFIDEAYSLESDDMYAKECVNTLCEALSDSKKDFMVIVAGYQQELEHNFFKVNNGLSSRFIWRFHIEPYTPSELHKIFVRMVDLQQWSMEDGIREKWFLDKKDSFRDNGRSMEQLLSLTKIAHAQRIYGQDPVIKKKLSLDDLKEGLKIYDENIKVTKDKMFVGLYI